MHHLTNALNKMQILTTSRRIKIDVCMNTPHSMSTTANLRLERLTVT